MRAARFEPTEAHSTRLPSPRGGFACRRAEPPDEFRPMQHRALTLKYRPQVFADMVGQDHVTAVLERALESKRIAHAYLFTGARGVGKTTTARILAKSLNCEKRASGELKGPDPCNTCT